MAELREPRDPPIDVQDKPPDSGSKDRSSSVGTDSPSRSKEAADAAPERDASPPYREPPEARQPEALWDIPDSAPPTGTEAGGRAAEATPEATEVAHAEAPDGQKPLAETTPQIEPTLDTADRTSPSPATESRTELKPNQGLRDSEERQGEPSPGLEGAELRGTLDAIPQDQRPGAGMEAAQPEALWDIPEYPTASERLKSSGDNSSGTPLDPAREDPATGASTIGLDGSADQEPGSGRAPKTSEQADTDPAARRVELREDTKRAIRDAAMKTPDGDYVDPNTLAVIPKDGHFHYGHKEGFEWWRTQQQARAEGWDRQQVIEYENDPSHYEIQDPVANLSHQYEEPR
jgi:HNH/ENDO VII superfamily nuclease with conserved GHE residues